MRGGASNLKQRMRTIHAVFHNDGAWIIARCLDLPVATQGKTFDAA